MADTFWWRLLEAFSALLRSQGGPSAGRVLLFRRCGLPLPPTRATASVAIHWVACADVGVPGTEGCLWRTQQHGFVMKQDAASDSHCSTEPRLRWTQPWFLHSLGSTTNDFALLAARRRKETTFPELAGRFRRARLVVLACEVGGRWSDESVAFLLVKKAREKQPEHKRHLPAHPKTLRSAEKNEQDQARGPWTRFLRDLVPKTGFDLPSPLPESRAEHPLRRLVRVLLICFVGEPLLMCVCVLWSLCPCSSA